MKRFYPEDIIAIIFIAFSLIILVVGIVLILKSEPSSLNMSGVNVPMYLLLNR